MERKTLDVRGTKCPVPIVKAKQAIDSMGPGDILDVLATDAGSVADFVAWAKTSKLAVLTEQRTETDGTGRAIYIHVLRRMP